MIATKRTVEADEKTIAQLEQLAQASHRPVGDLATQALQAYLEHADVGAGKVNAPTPVKRMSDLMLDEWPREEPDAFLNYLAEERQNSLQADAEQQRY